MSTPATAAAPAADLLYARSAAMVVLAGVLWSMGGFLVKLVDAADSIQIVLYRSLFVVPVAAGFILFRGGGLLRSTRALGWNGLLGSICLAGAFVTYVTALTLTTVANAAFVLATTPFVTALLARLLLGEPVRRITWVAMILAGSGRGGDRGTRDRRRPAGGLAAGPRFLLLLRPVQRDPAARSLPGRDTLAPDGRRSGRGRLHAHPPGRPWRSERCRSTATTSSPAR